MTFSGQRILYEDNHIIAVNKFTSDIVQSDKTGDTPLLEQVKLFIKQRDQKPGNAFLEVVHRIDRPVSGAIIFAKTSKGLSRMNKLFHDGNVKKVYWAAVGVLPREHEATVTHFILRNPHQNKSYAYKTERPGTKKAVLSYRLLGSTDRYFFMEIELKTGRHHQIRAQFAEMGMPIKGDLKYGFARSNPNGGIHLHSRYINFIHPVSSDNISRVAPPPDDILWKELLRIVEND
jgi:23S rRNA pseudouridine1911/1915/1917 synthase